MTDTKWTAGPWGVVDTHYPSIKSVSGPSFKITAVMWATDLQESDYQDRAADLQLIAAAPELYEALEAILNAGQWYESALEIDAHRGGEAPDGCKLEAMAMMALAKARGES